MTRPSWSVVSKGGVPYGIVLGLSLAAHAAALGGGFVWLDQGHLKEGLAVAPLAEWPSLFTQGFAGTGFYRPLMALSLSIDAALGGSVALFRWVTALWHALAAVLTMRAAIALGLSRPSGLMAGCAFAVHPLASSVASLVAFRSEAMLLSALLGLIIAHRGGKPLRAGACLFASGLTKETGLVLGPLFVGCLLLGRHLQVANPSAGEPPRSEMGPAVAETNLLRRLLMSEALAFGLVLLLRARFAPAFRASYEGVDLVSAVGTRLASLTKSFGTFLVVPWDGTLCDVFPITSLASGSALMGLCVLLGLAYLAWERRGVALFFALSLLPALQLVPVMRFWSPHYLYVALAFFCMIIAELSAAAPAGRWLLASAIAVLGVYSFQQSRRFTSDLALWGYEVARQPQCKEAHFYLGEWAGRHDQPGLARDHYRQALAPSPGKLAYVDRFAATANLGGSYLALREYSNARATFEEAIALAPTLQARRRMQHNLATSLVLTGELKSALDILEVEVRRSDALPESVKLHEQVLGLVRRASSVSH